MKLQELYDARIAPMLLQTQAERFRLRKRARNIAIPLVSVWSVFIVSGIYLLWDNQPLLVLMILGIFGTIGALIIGSVTLNHASKNLEEDFAKDVGEILTKHAFEGQYLQQPDDDFLAIRQLSDLGGVKFPGSGKRRYGTSGTWDKTDFRLIRVMFATSNNSNTTTKSSGHEHHSVYFDGLVIRLDVPDPMPTIVIRDKETFLDLRSHRPDKDVLETVQLGYEPFDAIYELWSDDPNAVLKYLGPSFAPAFMKVHNDYSVYNSAMSAAFVDGSFYLTIRRTNDTTGPGRRDASELLLPAGRCVEAYAPLVAFAYNEIIIPCRVIEMLALRRSS